MSNEPLNETYNEIHIILIINNKVSDVAYCGAKHPSIYVTEEFRIPYKIMCEECINKWENEDI